MIPAAPTSPRPFPRSTARRPLAGPIAVALAALTAAFPAAHAATLVAGPPNLSLAGLPDFLQNEGGPPCYPDVVAAAPDPTAPVRFPDNIPEEFAYYDLRTPRADVLGGGTVRFRNTIQGFGLVPGETPILRNFVRLELRGVPPGNYAVLDDPQGGLTGVTFAVDGDRTRIEFMSLSPNATNLGSTLEGPVHDLAVRGGLLTLARDGIVVAVLENDDFIGCLEVPDTLAPPATEPQASFLAVCGFLRCAFDASTSFPVAGSEIALYEWDFGDGATATGPRAVHAYATPGARDVTLKVTDATAATHQVTQTVTAIDGTPGLPPDPSLLPAVKFNPRTTSQFLGMRVEPGDLVAAVSASVNGGPFTPMDRVDDREWRAAAPPRNSVVQFHASLTDGTGRDSPHFLWPSFAPG